MINEMKEGGKLLEDRNEEKTKRWMEDKRTM